MADSIARPDPTLPEWLAAHAHAVSSRRLLIDLMGGSLAVAVGALWRPRGWPAVVAAGLCFAAFGAWALAERRLARPDAGWTVPRDQHVVAWRVLHAVAAVVGGSAAVLLGFALLFGVLGTWIS